MIRYFIATILFAAAMPAWCALNVFATVPEWGALTQELGGDKVNVYLATNPLQDTSKPSPVSSRVRATPTSSSRPAPSSRSDGCRSSPGRRAIRRSSPASPATSRPRAT